MSAQRYITGFLCIALLVALNTLGDLMMAKAMRRVGDVDVLRRKSGVIAVVRRVLTTPWFYSALGCMALGFFSLLTALSRIDVSVVIPAAYSLTFLSNLLGAKFFLKEHLDRRRWIAGLVVMCGVTLLAT
jgi:drug/metabolite transporter (DMT)-like permease